MRRTQIFRLCPKLRSTLLRQARNLCSWIRSHGLRTTGINRIFRSIHTIKGSSGFVGYTELESLAHAAEDLLVMLRDGKLQFQKSMGHVLLKCIDVFRSMLKAVESKDPSIALNGELLILKLQQLQQESTSPSTRPSGIGEIGLDSAAQRTDLDSVRDRSEPYEIAISAPGITSLPSSALSANTPKNETAVSPSKTTPDSSLQESSIRVDVSILDKLMTCVGELVLARNQILQHSNRTSDSGLQASAQRLKIITSELQEHVMKTRMQPIGNVWSKFPRLVRDLAVICGKQVRIEMEGKETELDKTIIEAVKDPLTHLVRNTVDHGIETPQARIQKGKSPEGCLYLRAYHEGGLVNIEIADDDRVFRYDHHG